MMMHRRRFLATAASAPAFLAPGLLGAQDKKKPAVFQEITTEQIRAVDRGLKWLAANQSPRTGAIGRTCPVAFTSLAGLAFMANNSTPYRGRYAENVRGCLKYILESAVKRGYISERVASGGGNSRMHGHGYATWFLAELYGMCGRMMDSGDEKVRGLLQRAVKVIEGSQSRLGGWYYSPDMNNTNDEGSVTVTQVQALRSARNSGILVNKNVIDHGIDYIKKSTYPDGTVAYSLGSRGSGGTYALTAAGMCVFAMYGMYDAPELKKGLSTMMDFLTGKRSSRGNHDYYAHLYGAQACFFAKRIKEEYWTQGYDIIRKDLLSKQAGDGSWSQGSYGGAFGTACATLVLQIPYRYLPIFQD